MNRKLYRSRKNVMLGGVCAGLGEYLNIDPSIIRIFFVLLAIGSGVGVMLYFILWIVLPREDTLESDGSFEMNEFGSRATRMGDELRQAVSQPNPQTVLYIGGGLVLMGLFFLLRNLNIPWLNWLREDLLWPVLLIVGGLVLLLRAVRKE